MTGTQISAMTPEPTLPDGGVVPFVVPPGTVGFDPQKNYIYDLGKDLLTRVSYTALALPAAAASVGSTDGNVQADIDARPTTAVLASSTGADMVGVDGGGTLQEYIDDPQISRPGLLPATAKSLVVNIREFGENVLLDGSQDNSDALEAMIAYGAKNMLINEGTLKTTRQIAWAGNNRIDFTDADVIVDMAGQGEFLRILESAWWFELVGLKGVSYPQSSGRVTDRAVLFAGSTLNRCLISDCDFGHGRVHINVGSNDTDCQMVIERCRWTSDDTAFQGTNSLQAQIGAALTDPGDVRNPNRGVRLRDLLFNVWCEGGESGQSDANFDIIKVTGNPYGSVLEDVDIRNHNPDVCAQIDLYTGGNAATIRGGSLINTQIHWKEFEQSTVNSACESFLVDGVKMLGEPDWAVGTGAPAFLFLKGQRWKVVNCFLEKRWPGYSRTVDAGGTGDGEITLGEPNANFRAIWCNETICNVTAETGKSPWDYIIANNHILVGYDTNASNYSVYPVYLNQARSGIIANNVARGGKDFAIVAGASTAGITVCGNNWTGSFDRGGTVTAATHQGALSSGNVWNGLAGRKATFAGPTGSVAAGDVASVAFAMQSCVIGDHVEITAASALPNDNAKFRVWGVITGPSSSSGTLNCTAYFHNPTTGALTLGAADWMAIGTPRLT